MKIFLDTAEVEEIREAASWGVLAGVTTNPSLVAKSGRDFGEVVREIANIAKAPVSAEVVSTEAPTMIEEGRRYAEWSPHVVVKAPMTPEGLKATSTLASEGIRVNVTLVFSANQALLAARAGAAYVSPFIGRLDDISQSGIELVREIADIFLLHDIASEIIAASVRHPVHVTEAAKAGAHIATIPFKVLQQIVKHPLTDQGLEKFLQDWANANK